MNAKCLLAAAACLALGLTPTLSAQTVEINYQNLELGFHQPGALNQLVLTQRSNSIASAFLKDGSGVTLDSADIFNLLSGQWFDLLFCSTVTDGAGVDDISIVGTFTATDNVTTPAAPSVAAGFVNADLSGDPDGVSFGSGVLRVEGVIQALPGNDSILTNPTPDWLYQGGANGTAPGLDGVADQLTIAGAFRPNYQTGILAILEVNLDYFADGTSTAGLNADELFSLALSHGGFVSTDAQLQLTVIPEPAAPLLAALGLVTLGCLRRRV